jgi:hypothetical protein
MPDPDLKILITTSANTEGAQAASDAIQDVVDKANAASDTPVEVKASPEEVQALNEELDNTIEKLQEAGNNDLDVAQLNGTFKNLAATVRTISTGSTIAQGSIAGLRDALRGLFVLMAANPYLAAAAGIGILVTAIAKWRSDQSKAAEAVKDTTDATKDLNDAPLDKVRDQVKQTRDVVAELVDQLQRANRLKDELADAQLAQSIAALDLAEQQALGGAKTDSERRAISIDYSSRRSGLRTQSELTKSQGAQATAQATAQAIAQELIGLSLAASSQNQRQADAEALVRRLQESGTAFPRDISSAQKNLDEIRAQRDPTLDKRLADLQARLAEAQTKAQVETIRQQTIQTNAAAGGQGTANARAQLSAADQAAAAAAQQRAADEAARARQQQQQDADRARQQQQAAIDAQARLTAAGASSALGTATSGNARGLIGQAQATVASLNDGTTEAELTAAANALDQVANALASKDESIKRTLRAFADQLDQLRSQISNSRPGSP